MSVSCLVDDEDPTLDIFAATPYVVGFNQNVANESYFVDIGAVEKSYPVNLVGGQDGTNPTSDLVLNYVINQTETTAQEGVEFDFLENTGQLVIPAGSDFGLFNILINTGNLDPNMPTVLALEITSVEGDAANVGTINNLNFLFITFVGCNSQLAQDGTFGNYFLDLMREDGSTRQAFEVVEWIGPNQFLTESTGHWGINGIAPDTSMNFEDVCGEVSVPNQGLAQGYYGNQVFGTNLTGPDGSVDQTTLDFDLSYIITFGTGPLQHDSTYTRQ